MKNKRIKPYCIMNECFACSNNECDILTKKVSRQNVACPFFKTKQQLGRDRMVALNRLMSLPNGQELIKKYYGEN